MPKYKMLPVERPASSNGPDLYIIVSQEDFYAFDGTFIPCGTEGGFIESSSNLPNRKGDRSWIFSPNGYVVGNATIDNSVVRFGYVSGNSKITKSIIDKKSAIMGNAHVINSTIFDSVIGVSSRLENCTLNGGCCINLYDRGSILDTDAKDASISGNIIMTDCNVKNAALHCSEDRWKSYTREVIKNQTRIDNIYYPYRDKYGTKDYMNHNMEDGVKLRRAKDEGELRVGYNISQPPPKV